MLKFNEYFDTEELKNKDEIKFLKGETKDEVEKLSSNPRDLKYVEKVIRSLNYNNPFIGNFQVSFGTLPNASKKSIIDIREEINVNDKRVSAISFIKVNITFNKDKSFSVSCQCEVKVADTDKDVEYKILYEDLLNKNVESLEELNDFFRKEVYPFFKKWDKWSYSVTGKSSLSNKEVEFKDEMVIDNLKGGDLKIEEDPNFNPQFNSKSYNNLKGYQDFL